MKPKAMAHNRFEFDMPASAEVVFDAFHYHDWRARWDSLVNDTHVIGGASCPFVGAVTKNSGAGWLRALSMRTQFVTYDRPRVAAATMLGSSFPFVRWAASMQHHAIDSNRSIMIYTYNFKTGPKFISWLLEPFVKHIFNRKTQERFRRLEVFLREHAEEIKQWQQDK